MDVQIHLLIGSISILFLAIFLAIGQHKERLSTIPSLRDFTRKIIRGERRIYPRYKTSLRAKYKTPSEEEGVSWIRNISRGGVQLFLNKSFPINTFLRLEIHLPYDSKPIFAQGGVVWTQNENGSAGLSFSEVNQPDINRIIEYIGHKEQMKYI